MPSRPSSFGLRFLQISSIPLWRSAEQFVVDPRLGSTAIGICTKEGVRILDVVRQARCYETKETVYSQMKHFVFQVL